MNRVSLNIDLGELPDEPDELYSLATVVNIACGGHAGDQASMHGALVLAQKANARVAAHPSYPDREGFGRKTMKISAADLRNSLQLQMAQLSNLANVVGVDIVAVKPHGALYHDLHTSPEWAEAFLSALDDVFASSVAVVGPPQGSMGKTVTSRDRRYWREGFADRTYLSDGRLAPRSHPDALITDPDNAAAQALRLARQNQFDTLCVHGDTPNALAVARAVRQTLANAGFLDEL